jgi:hypothetical protein
MTKTQNDMQIRLATQQNGITNGLPYFDNLFNKVKKIIGLTKYPV